MSGIGVAVDGSKDGEIHRLRQGGMATDAAPEIFRLTAEMFKAKATNLEDPFARLDDDDHELDTNELVTEDMNWTQTAQRYAVTIFMAW